MKPAPRLVLKVLVLLGCLVPIALVAADIVRHGQNVPFQDEWVDPVDIALLTAEGTLTAGDLFRQYNDSRTVFTYLLTAASTALAGWSLRLEMFASMGLAAITLLVLTSLYGASHRAGRLLVALPFSILVFSIVQRRSWLWAIQSQYFFLIAFTVAALWTLRRRPPGWPPLLGAAVLTLGATFSFASGFTVWFVMLPVLWMLGYRGPHLAGWTAAAALGLAAFFAGYRFRLLQVAVTFDPPYVARFVAVYLGNVFTVREVTVHPPAEIALNTAIGALGLVGFAVNLALVWRGRRRWADLAPWIGLALFVLISAALAAIARQRLGGIEVAMASRYVTMATMFWVAFVAVAALAMAEPGPARRWVRAGNGVMLAVLLVLLVRGSFTFAATRATVTEAQRACLLAYPTSRDATCFGNLLTARTGADAYPESLLRKIEPLARHRLGAFGEPPRR